MKICVLGGTGFIGSHIVSTLISAGHKVIIGCKDIHRAQTVFPNATIMPVVAGQSTQQLVNALQGCDVVINSIGVLGKPGTSLAEDAHIQLIKDLILACQKTQTNRIIHISVVSLENDTTNEYNDTKLQAEILLKQSSIETIILRASFVYSTGSYGGSSSLRGLCAMPWIALLPLNGQQKFQPLWAFDLAKVAEQACKQPLPTGTTTQTLQLSGPQTLNVVEIMQKTRSWLGMKPCNIYALPMFAVKLMGKIGDYFPLWGFSSGMTNPLAADFVIPPEQINTLGIPMRSMDEAYQAHPSFVQDRWHSKLFLAKPILALFLAVIWLISAISGFLVKPEYLNTIFPSFITSATNTHLLILSYFFSCIDLYFFIMIILGKWSQKLWLSQITLICLYTIGIGLLSPILWIDPLGALLKNFAVIGLTIVMLCINDNR